MALVFPGIPWWWPMMAQTGAAPADVISTTAATTIITTIFTGIALVMGKVWGKRQEAQKRTTTIAGQPIGVRLEEQSDPPATKKELEALEQRMIAELKKIEAALGKERDIARTANGNLHARADKSVEVMAEMKGELKQISENVDRLLDLAMKRPSR
jgi:hypothetical protein